MMTPVGCRGGLWPDSRQGGLPSNTPCRTRSWKPTPVERRAKGPVVLFVGTLAMALTTGAAHSALSQQPGPAAASDSAPASTKTGVDPRAVQPERPTVATHAYTIAPGYVEIEMGVQAARPRGGTEFAAPVVAKVGVIPRLQLELQSGYVRITGVNTAAGATDFAVALKQRVTEAGPVLGDVSIQGSIKFPTGARSVGTGTTDLSLLLIASRRLGAAEFDLNAGYSHRSGDGTVVPTSATLLTASFSTPIIGGLGAVAELFDYPGTAGPAGAPPSVGFLVGPTLQLRPWLVLDAGAILNVQNLRANAAYAGLTYSVGRIPGFPGARHTRKAIESPRW